MDQIWFWHRIVSPHMAGLAIALAHRGCQVTYVAERAMSADRAQQGWAVPLLPGVDLAYAADSSTVAALVRKAPADAVHICEGIRANGLVAVAQRALAARGLRQWVVMETVNDAVWYGALKRAEYSRLFHARKASLEGIFATGHRTAEWVTERGVPANRVFPFAYFMPDDRARLVNHPRKPGAFRFIFAGQLIPRKRVDWLLDALGFLADRSFELCIVGTGSEEPILRSQAQRVMGNQVSWLGQFPLAEVPAVMAQADCLVLPSLHDGWGAVASESLMTGTPVICSDACGVAGAVKASGRGGVFAVNDRNMLTKLLTTQIQEGLVTAKARQRLATWATCLGANAGAVYLQEILSHNTAREQSRPVAPWLRKRVC